MVGAFGKSMPKMGNGEMEIVQIAQLATFALVA
jgi:hypothetical protein